MLLYFGIIYADYSFLEHYNITSADKYSTAGLGPPCKGLTNISATLIQSALAGFTYKSSRCAN